MGKKSTSIMFAHFGHACNVRPFGWHASQRLHDFVLKWHGKSFWDLSHIDKRSAPPMPYKLELKAWVYPYKNYYRRVCKNNIYSSIILFSLSLHLMTFLFLFLRINDFFVLLFLYIILLYSYIILMCWMLKTRMLDVL